MSSSDLRRILEQPCSNCGLRLFYREGEAPPACYCETSFNTELTPAGEQFVISGTERNDEPGTTQLNLF